MRAHFTHNYGSKINVPSRRNLKYGQKSWENISGFPSVDKSFGKTFLDFHLWIKLFGKQFWISRSGQKLLENLPENSRRDKRFWKTFLDFQPWTRVFSTFWKTQKNKTFFQQLKDPWFAQTFENTVVTLLFDR